VPTTCFNCESACGLLAYIDRETGQIQKFEGNPENPGSRGRNCAKGPEHSIRLRIQTAFFIHLNARGNAVKENGTC
jgi:hypothetical protein